MKHRTFSLAFVISAALACGLAACSDDASSGTVTPQGDAAADSGASQGTDGGSGSSSDDAASSDVDASTDAATANDAAADEDASSQGDAATDAGCTLPVAADLNGAEDCKTLAFGVTDVAFEASDKNGPQTSGGAIPDGIYDISRAERDHPKGTWRETLVFGDNGKFTRVRQIDTGSGNGKGPVTRVSGTYTTNGNQITFTTACASGGGKVGDETTLPYGVTTTACGHASFFITVTGARITYTQR